VSCLSPRPLGADNSGSHTREPKGDRSSVQITSTETHPNVVEILGVLSQMVHLDDQTMSRLAHAWDGTSPLVATARDRALSPESPLVCEALAALDSVSYLFADELAGTESYITLPAPVSALALKAVRDAIAAAYARPILAVDEYDALMAPWHAVFEAPTQLAGPDFGPQHHEVVQMLTYVPQLACRSHDPSAAALWRRLRDGLTGTDFDELDAAIDRGWVAAVTTSRRRLWRMLTRSCSEGYFRRCAQCRSVEPSEEELIVLRACLGAAYGLLVADVLDPKTRDLLTRPAATLNVDTDIDV
jgi:hypothetical protein